MRFDSSGFDFFPIDSDLFQSHAADFTVQGQSRFWQGQFFQGRFVRDRAGFGNRTIAVGGLFDAWAVM